MAHIDLRDLHDDDLDAVFEMMRDPEAVALAGFTPADPDDRAAFDAWCARNRAAADATQWVITEDGGFAGIAAVFSLEERREVMYWVARHAWGRGVGTAALRLMIAREAERPLYARVAAHNTASVALLERVGFTETERVTAFAPGVGRELEEIVYTLVPTLE